MAKSVQARRHEFTAKERKRIVERDGGQCIFCKMGYDTGNASWMDLQIDGIMHYIPRSRGGLGIAENGALGCRYHHRMLDNGRYGSRDEMLEMFKAYLQQHHSGWDEKKLMYSKWDFLEEVKCSGN